jgi:hypothetical protein
VIWILILAGLVLLVTPFNMRFQISRTRQRIAAQGGNVERFERFEASPVVRAVYIGVPVLGLVLILVGLVA